MKSLKRRSSNQEAHLKFFGAIDGEVMGSCHLYTTYVDGQPFRVLMDAGKRKYEDNPDYMNETHTSGLAYSPDITLLTHSHLDHCGRLPILYKEGFRGDILGSHQTLEGVKITLRDAFRLLANKKERFHRSSLRKLKDDLRKKWKFIDTFKKDIQTQRHLYEDDVNIRILKMLEQGQNIRV